MLEALYEYAGTFCTKSDGAEADDWCGIAGRNATENGDSFILSHIDKDLNTLVGRHHNFKKGVIYDTSKEESTRFLMQQLITGDSADSIFGIYGMGPVKAKRLLDAHGPESLWATVVGTWQYNHEADWKEKLTKCANLIYIRDREADLRNLTFEELEDRIAWKTT
jgi:5'-3' exonuclease